jgi:hypothetical protein
MFAAKAWIELRLSEGGIDVGKVLDRKQAIKELQRKVSANRYWILIDASPMAHAVAMRLSEWLDYKGCSSPDVLVLQVPDGEQAVMLGLIFFPKEVVSECDLRQLVNWHKEPMRADIIMPADVPQAVRDWLYENVYVGTVSAN